MYLSSLTVPVAILTLIYMVEPIFHCHVVLGATSGPVSLIRHQSHADQMHRLYLDGHLALVPNCVRELFLLAPRY